MTYIEILSLAKMGVEAEIAKTRSMQEKAIEGQALDIGERCQHRIDKLEVKRAVLDELVGIHNRDY